ncbi:MAG: tRNA (adenosine(37)-N6)-dimethylallyltransferase MiaA [Sedimentisphaerales bacterium]|nr:tRNA (adenosine(37)-N6)-dimethylallyltransferase MiaA [Sedimentisphaerales bacterium]
MILILGVTASGKGRLAFDLAQNLNAEIISIDSMKVYRRMDIGTAKPSKEAREKIKYHMLDIVEPSDSFSVGAFYEQAIEAISRIKARDKKIIASGGTALYIKALLYGLFDDAGTDESIRKELRGRIENEGSARLHMELSEIDAIAAERINPNDAKRIIRALEVYKITGKPISSFQKQWETHGTKFSARQNNQSWTIIGLRRDKAEESGRINQRVKKIIHNGLVDEVESLLREEKPLSRQARCAIGYSEIIDYLEGKTNLEEAVELIKKNTRKLAKGQRTWFKTFRDVHWLDIEPEEPHENILQRTQALLENITS